jgi:HSP20 family protein
MARNAFQDIEQRFDDLRRDLLGRWAEPSHGLLPSDVSMAAECDVCDVGNDYVVTLNAPGFEKRDIHVDVENRGLRVWANASRESNEPANATYLRRERTARSFERYVTFPEEVSAAGARATYKNGVLEVTLPKTAPEKRNAKSIEIQ